MQYCSYRRKNNWYFTIFLLINHFNKMILVVNKQYYQIYFSHEIARLEKHKRFHRRQIRFKILKREFLFFYFLFRRVRKPLPLVVMYSFYFIFLRMEIVVSIDGYDLFWSVRFFTSDAFLFAAHAHLSTYTDVHRKRWTWAKMAKTFEMCRKFGRQQRGKMFHGSLPFNQVL